MKKIVYSIIALLCMVVLPSCENDDPTAFLSTDVQPNELQPVSGSNFVLLRENEANQFKTFEWTATDFGFDASVSYTVQVDVAGNNFESPFELALTRSLSAAVTVGKMNEAMLALELTPEQASNVEVRVVSVLSNNVNTIYSNIQTLSITPYATSFPPIWGMGAGLKGWGPWPANAVEWQSSEFKKYSTIAYFTNGQAFRWFAQLDWNPTSYNYPFFTSVSTVFENANDGDSNLKVVGATGWYRVDVDLSAKTVTAEAVDEPLMYMTGAGIGGWDQPGTGASVKMTYVKPGVFEAETNFISGGAFRFFAQANWSPVSYNYPFFESVDALFENANDGDSNLKYIGTTGTQKVTVDINAKTVTVGEPPAPVLFITGDDFGWGWSSGQYAEFTYNAGAGTFSVTATLTNGNLFRFFPQKGWDPSYKFDYFTSVDSELENQGAGTDQNFRYVGTTGSRTITVNLTAKTVAVN